uniref:Uncharacterized protein n=1 Tax=Anopheles atroparvus TaxID=41427 RepID=A0A182IJG8_ANOAO
MTGEHISGCAVAISGCFSAAAALASLDLLGLWAFFRDTHTWSTRGAHDRTAPRCLSPSNRDKQQTHKDGEEPGTVLLVAGGMKLLNFITVAETDNMPPSTLFPESNRLPCPARLDVLQRGDVLSSYELKSHKLRLWSRMTSHPRL